RTSRSPETRARGFGREEDTDGRPVPGGCGQAGRLVTRPERSIAHAKASAAVVAGSDRPLGTAACPPESHDTLGLNGANSPAGLSLYSQRWSEKKAGMSNRLGSDVDMNIWWNRVGILLPCSAIHGAWNTTYSSATRRRVP